MARANRSVPPGRPYHVVNRGNDRRAVFLETVDYKTFAQLLDAGSARFGTEVHAHCLMPNHFHLVLEPSKDEELSAFMQWVTGRYSCYFRSRTRTMGYGHVFQRRFWSAPIRDDIHFLMVLRYVEANPLRAGLVQRAEEWEWSSLSARARGHHRSGRSRLVPPHWSALVNLVQREELLDCLRQEIAPCPGRPPGRPAPADS